MELEDLPDLEQVPPSKVPIYCNERHLSTAITTTEVDYVLAHHSNTAALRPHHRRILEDLQGTTILPSSGFLAWCCTDLSRWCSKGHPDSELLLRAARVVRYGAREAYRHFYRIEPPNLLNAAIPTDTLYAQLSTTWYHVIATVSSSSEARMTITVGDIDIILEAEICLVKVTSKTCFLVPYSLIICFADMCASWYSVSCYSYIHDRKYPGYSLYFECLAMMMALQTTLQRSYSLFKIWPSLIIGTILRDLENAPTFLRTITDEIDNALLNTEFFRHETGPIAGSVHAMMKLELCGLWKTMGHPIINMLASTASWMRKGTVMKPGLHPSGDRINNMFKKEFCRQFYKTHKKLPNVSLNTNVNPHIQSCNLAGEWGETGTLKWDPHDFSAVHLHKTFEFDYHVDTIDIISDKAIIPKPSEWIHEYDGKAFRTLYGRFLRGPAPTTKSVVIHYLTTDIFNCEEIIQLINVGIVPQEWRVMVAVPKEREFKETDARCQMTPEMRAYQVVTEKNIADVIFRYIKHQSMTLSEEQLTKTLMRMSKPGGDHDYINIIIDFSAWCTHFRAELLAPLFASLDALFGFEHVYGFTHTFPLISYLLFQDRYAPPDQDNLGRPVEGSHCVRGPEAWLEGRRQKGWTLATILIILQAAHICDTTASPR